MRRFTSHQFRILLKSANEFNKSSSQCTTPRKRSLSCTTSVTYVMASGTSAKSGSIILHVTAATFGVPEFGLMFEIIILAGAMGIGPIQLAKVFMSYTNCEL